jgi:diadenosine tetraphosphate (Ap4A) HIT family hydrolase
MSLDRLWAGWRSSYIDAIGGEGPPPLPPGEGSLFERILGSGLGDREAFVLWRGRTCAALLNAYPYISGHLMVMPKRAIARLEDLDVDTFHELWEGVRLAVIAINAAYRPDGMNVGVNLGEAGGAGVPDHLHVHVMPRWAGDTNFMTTVADTRVLPEPLGVTWEKLRAGWPAE